jgi:sugar phosphate isomerase/epimerase
VQFVKDTQLHNLRFCFDIGHAHIEGGAVPGYRLMHDRTVTVHIHDNHSEKDEHLLPWEGTIDWGAAWAEFAAAPEPLPLVLELKETAPGSPSLDQIRSIFDKIEEQLDEKGASSAHSGPARA